MGNRDKWVIKLESTIKQSYRKQSNWSIGKSLIFIHLTFCYFNVSHIFKYPLKQILMLFIVLCGTNVSDGNFVKSSHTTLVRVVLEVYNKFYVFSLLGFKI